MGSGEGDAKIEIRLQPVKPFDQSGETIAVHKHNCPCDKCLAKEEDNPAAKTEY